MDKRSIIGLGLGLGLSLLVGACGAEKRAADAAASGITSVALVQLEEGPVVAIVKEIRISRSKGVRSFFRRLDTHDLVSGARKASFLWPEGAPEPRCYAAPRAQLWCMEGTPPAPLLRDARTLVVAKEAAALAAEVPALASGVARVSPVPGTGELLVWTGDGDRWLLGAGPAKRDATTPGLRSARSASTLTVPAGELSFGGPAHDLTLHLIASSGASGRQDTGLRGLRSAKFLTDLATGEALRWDERSLAIMTHEGKRDGRKRVVVGLGFDAAPRWTTEIPAGVIEAAIHRPKSFVLVVRRGPSESALVSITIEDGKVEWQRGL